MRLPTTPLTTLLRELRDEVRQHYRGGRVIIAVDGIDGAGKTTFADAFADVFAEDGSSVFRASIDDFHRPRAERYQRGRRSPEGYYRDSYDYATFRRVLIDPFRDGAQTAGTTGFQLAAFDVARDTPVEATWTTAPRDAVLIVDGIFLLRPELRGLWDWSVWLDAPVDVAYQRMALRDGSDPNPAAASNLRYRDGQELYLKDARPRLEASAIVDNADLAHPRRTFEDYC
ncbi:uridine kinase [Microbacterium sp. zg.B48]|uniref:uridine kinase n=1 Tax=unclassified Microbacterium TaxID=2609290 RepID=UPI00214BA35A|nr:MULTISPECIES: uridine kinase [unclassified Microbacterium]MCR2764769.1 uridine kinase [Microbacterium sp. zg.B48]MCR2810093.1 uridine kinase [Microbacterium sp. zg.B185]WIM20070.1 uridine kinase [Microbacterium sp. zg-B185]